MDQSQLTCEHCPCPDVCLERPAHCKIAAKPDRTDFDVRVICERSRMARYPSATQQIINAAGAIGRVAGAIATGQPVLASKEVQAARQAICDACEHYDAAQKRCRKCGCFGLKTHLALENCPIGKWLKAESEV